MIILTKDNEFYNKKTKESLDRLLAAIKLSALMAAIILEAIADTLEENIKDDLSN